MPDLKEDLHSDYMVLNMGPSHPATHGTVKFLLTLDGETIIDCIVEVGYLHRGFEKMCESVTWTNVFPYTDRLNYCSAIMNNIGYALAVEKLLGIECTERCQYIRVVTNELSRISDHYTNIAAAALELGNFIKSRKSFSAITRTFNTLNIRFFTINEENFSKYIRGGIIYKFSYFLPCISEVREWTKAIQSL